MDTRKTRIKNRLLLLVFLALATLSFSSILRAENKESYSVASIEEDSESSVVEEIPTSSPQPELNSGTMDSDSSLEDSTLEDLSLNDE